MMLLNDILNTIASKKIVGEAAKLSIDNIQFNSRNITSGGLFVAIVGSVVDGRNYIAGAIKQGAVSVVCESLPDELENNVCYVLVEDSSAALAIMASNFYGNPSANLKLVGVTGTNGKTTIATLLFNLFKAAGYKVGLLSTVVTRVNDKEYEATHTTPDSLTINRYLVEMNNEGVDYCFMEVSSHGIHQKRTKGLAFVGGVFSNLTHDHLDYHNTFAEYRDVKKQFFDGLSKNAFALVNSDDKNGAFMLQNTKAKQYKYGLKNYADYKAKILENSFNGMLLNINGSEVWTKLVGGFNASNILAIFAVAELLGLEKNETLRIISALENVKGRFQYFISENKVTAIVDYAHTPDALKNVLETINSICSKNESVITVVGCGGDRDVDKRPKMGHIASALSTSVIFTSDNPRTENPEVIIAAIEQGVEPENVKKTLSITNREQAIKTACQLANKGDVILIAGKGHETYQEVNGVRSDFNDFEIVEKILKQLEK